MLAGLLGFSASLSGCGAPLIESCSAAAGFTVDCRFRNPEDIVESPSGDALIVSEFGRLDGAGPPGRIVAYRPREAGGDGAIVPLFPLAATTIAAGATPSTSAASWGDPRCTPPDTARFSPHGIDLERLDSGEFALYVVTHGARESVEMFEVVTEPALALRWRGCVEGPPEANFNDVVVLRDGGFWVSQSFPHSANTIVAGLRMRYLGATPGFAYRWSESRGFERISGTDVAYANGIEKSADERTLYLNAYFGNRMIVVDVASGTRVGEVAVPGPDNLSWAPEGRLLIASHLASTADLLRCLDIERGQCGFGFQVIAVDPASLTTEVRLQHRGPPMGAVTVARPYRGRLYLGTFAGDRLVSH